MAEASRAGSQFDLSGGWLCLDFANTLLKPSSGAPEERLRSYADLVAFARQADALGEAEAARLARAEARRPADALRALAEARRLRGAIFGLFAGAAAGRGPDPGDVAVLNEVLSRATGHLHVDLVGDRLVVETVASGEALDRMLGPIARSAAYLLASPGLGSVRQCPARPCEWLFMDTTKNSSRRYCDVRTCGNRMRVRRHRERHRGGVTA